MGEEEKRQIGKDLVPLAEVSRRLAEEHLKQQDWSGLPVTVPGLQLVLEPRYKHQFMSEFRWKECYDEDGVRHDFEEEQQPKPSEFRTVNSWWNDRYQVTILVVKDKQGRAQSRLRLDDRLSFTLRTLEAAGVWPVEAERKAMKRLASLLPADQFDLYELTGHFAEASERSRVTYLFRKGRPTIALREAGERFILLCALCLHPIGYYADSWAGVTCPTDEVIAHLLMMRGSEEKYWANANQHPLDHPAAGV